MTKLAWRLTVDTQRTLVILEYPPHVVALACIYISALLSSFERPPPPPPLEHPHMDMDGASSSQDRTAHEVAALLSVTGTWEQQYQARTEDLDGEAPPRTSSRKY
jgi:CTD kinase subunit beta